MNAVLAERARISATDSVLDSGCGWGGSTIWLYQNRKCDALGITLEGEQVAKCWEKAEDAKVARYVNFLRADFHDTPFRDGAFDVVWALESFCHSDDKPRVLREAHRLLKRGGRLIVADYFRAARDLNEPADSLLRVWLDQWVVPGLDTIPEYTTYLVQAGFETLDAEDITDRVRFSSLLLYKKGCRLAPFARLLNKLRPWFYTDMSHANWRSSILQHEALEAGAWRYGIILARKP
ncbi:MAG: methyltransferase domain-containing protein [Candidatus Zixiibacteriota bacterium]